MARLSLRMTCGRCEWSAGGRFIRLNCGLIMCPCLRTLQDPTDAKCCGLDFGGVMRGYFLMNLDMQMDEKLGKFTMWRLAHCFNGRATTPSCRVYRVVWTAHVGRFSIISSFARSCMTTSLIES
jgi:hypothetical protein